MYNKIEQDIKQDYYQKKYSNDGQRFVAWYLRNIHGLDIYEAKECITDRANDKQIDAVYVNNQDTTVYIIQGKYYSGEYVDATPVREIFGAWGLLQDLETLQENANSQLKAKINEVSVALDDGYSICFELITTSMLTKQALSDAEAFNKQITENNEMNAHLSIIDNETLKFRYEENLGKISNCINCEFQLEDNKYLELDINGTKAVLAAVPLRDCVNIPGIKDGRLFRKNVRQSLGSSNKINKGIAKSLKREPADFFFCHNGITAVCSKVDLKDGTLKVKDLNVVNGCQSLTTIFNSGETAKKSYGYVLFKFYEMPNSEKADKITNCTNSQSAVKARDLRSNDNVIVKIKKNYEHTFPNGYMITKRGEIVDKSVYDENYIVQLTDLGKQLVSWHSQRPTLAYSETKIFDVHFNQLFKKDYPAEDIQALHELHQAVAQKWVTDNPLDMNETLFAMKSYALMHHLYAVSVFFAEASNMSDMVPKPSVVIKQLKDNDMLDYVIVFAGKALNRAFLNAQSKYKSDNKIFTPPNWLKQKASINALTETIRSQLDLIEYTNPEYGKKIKKCCKIDKIYFENRWSAE